MPLNILKKYPDLLDLSYLNESDRTKSLSRVFERDIVDNVSFNFRGKLVRPTKEEGIPSMQTLFNHLTTRKDEDEKGQKLSSRSFDMPRSVRLHWILYHIRELVKEKIIIFSYEDRIKRKDVIRTYIYNKDKQYVIILEPQRSKKDYYLLTAYHISEKKGKNQINSKYKRRLNVVY